MHRSSGPLGHGGGCRSWLSARRVDVAAITKVSFTSADRVREVISNFNTYGIQWLYPRYSDSDRSGTAQMGVLSRIDTD